MIEDLRVNADIPFDELYHREKSLIQNVIDAELSLQKKQEGLDSPLPSSIKALTSNTTPYAQSKS